MLTGDVGERPLLSGVVLQRSEHLCATVRVILRHTAAAHQPLLHVTWQVLDVVGGRHGRRTRSVVPRLDVRVGRIRAVDVAAGGRVPTGRESEVRSRRLDRGDAVRHARSSKIREVQLRRCSVADGRRHICCHKTSIITHGP